MPTDPLVVAQQARQSDVRRLAAIERQSRVRRKTAIGLLRAALGLLIVVAVLGAFALGVALLVVR